MDTIFIQFIITAHWNTTVGLRHPIEKLMSGSDMVYMFEK